MFIPMIPQPTAPTITDLEAQREALDRLIAEAAQARQEAERHEQERQATERAELHRQRLQEAEFFRQHARQATTDSERRDLYRYAAEAEAEARTLIGDVQPDPYAVPADLEKRWPRTRTVIYYLRANALRLLLGGFGFWLAVHSSDFVAFGGSGVALEGDVRLQQVLFSAAAFLGLESVVSLLTLFREPELADYNRAGPRQVITGQDVFGRRSDLTQLPESWQRLLAYYGLFSFRLLMLVYLYSRMCG